MTTTNQKTVLACIDIEAIVDESLKQRAIDTAEKFRDFYDYLVPACRDAMSLRIELEQYTESLGVSDAVEALLKDDARWEEHNGLDIGLNALVDEVTGYSTLDRALRALMDLLEITAEKLDRSELDETPAVEVSK